VAPGTVEDDDCVELEAELTEVLLIVMLAVTVEVLLAVGVVAVIDDSVVLVAVGVLTVIDDDTVVLEAELVEVLLIVVVRTPMQIYCMVAEG